MAGAGMSSEGAVQDTTSVTYSTKGTDAVSYTDGVMRTTNGVNNIMGPCWCGARWSTQEMLPAVWRLCSTQLYDAVHGSHKSSTTRNTSVVPRALGTDDREWPDVRVEQQPTRPSPRIFCAVKTAGKCNEMARCKARK